MSSVLVAWRTAVCGLSSREFLFFYRCEVVSLRVCMYVTLLPMVSGATTSLLIPSLLARVGISSCFATKLEALVEHSS